MESQSVIMLLIRKYQKVLISIAGVGAVCLTGATLVLVDLHRAADIVPTSPRTSATATEKSKQVASSPTVNPPSTSSSTAAPTSSAKAAAPAATTPKASAVTPPNVPAQVPTTPAPTGPVPAGIPGTWQLKFADEFSGSSLDLTKWRPNWLGNSNTSVTPPPNSLEPECYDPAQVAVSNGNLVLSVVQRNCLATNNTTYPYASGLVESNGRYNYTYGVTEARIWIPAVDGQGPVDWPAFWTDGQNWPNDGEDDIMEVLGGRTCFTYHYSGGALGSTCTNHKAGWHTFASNWQSNKVTYYYDGVQVGSYNVTIGSPHYIIINLGLHTGSEVVPAQMLVDYVRVWQ